MKYSELGTSGMNASCTALGVMRMNSKTAEESAQIVRTALDGGVNFFDTADCYTHGESSRHFGQALQDLKVDRSKIYVQTKVGIHRDTDSDDQANRYDFTKQYLVDQVNSELKNLQTDYVDSVLLHRPDQLMELEQIAEAFDELQNSGKVRHFGVSNFSPMQVEMLQSGLDQKLEVNQLQFGLGHTGMVRQEMHVNMTDAPSVDHDGGLISYSRLRHMTIQAWSPFQFGFFEGVFIDNPKFPELNEVMQRVADAHGVTKNAIAVAWILRHPAHMQVLLGSMTPSRLTEMVAGADVELSAQEWYDLYFAAGNDLP
ncbi:aldo/keto reductase [Bifidobacterium sp. ESL0704]|uniref:aldo/keto reductase n=1 Tax=Bifidobacterium sp. ESL0704 TaxID=2983219 RepID=UPI0023F93960|nr:aldo/keto reductase [Bifidobacterium sp. ESL0704]WEV52883.1 aldo/keto reductase [Bifidobacterium sp. ESL0704]